MYKRQVPPSAELNALLVGAGTSPLTQGASLAQLLRRPEVSLEALLPFAPELVAAATPTIRQRVEIEVKYAGYIQKQFESVERFLRLEEKRIPDGFDYSRLLGLSLEAREKLSLHRPQSVGQASRIMGVTPADISVLLVLSLIHI